MSLSWIMSYSELSGTESPLDSEHLGEATRPLSPQQILIPISRK